MNTKSNHQNAFFTELNKDEQIDLQVRYISQPSHNRIEIGWDNSNLENYEQYVLSFENAVQSIDDMEQRIHIILGNKITYSQKLIDLFIENKYKWVHWSERYGLILANKLKFNMFLFNLLRPIYLLSKRSYGKIVNNNALGVFSHGKLAKKDFESIGINKDMIEDLYYTSDIRIEPNTINFNEDITKFLYIGELSERKGIKKLLNACSKIKTENWKVTIVGSDKSNGEYLELSKKLNLQNKITFTGVIPHDKIIKFYKDSHVFVFPSKFDGWGAVLNEAVSYGLPIISTNETSSSFTLVKDNGFIINAGDISELSNAMKEYINNKELIIEHSNNSKKLSHICTPKANVERFINALNKWNKLNG
jgi:glycosyltransferase involved in cell wall biosynthesis